MGPGLRRLAPDVLVEKLMQALSQVAFLKMPGAVLRQRQFNLSNKLEGARGTILVSIPTRFHKPLVEFFDRNFPRQQTNYTFPNLPLGHDASLQVRLIG